VRIARIGIKLESLKKEAFLSTPFPASTWHTNIDCPDATLIRIQSKGKFGIPVRDGGSSFIAIDYCPWCGMKL